jgi:hypothetical protein
MVSMNRLKAWSQVASGQNRWVTERWKLRYNVTKHGATVRPMHKNREWEAVHYVPQCIGGRRATRQSGLLRVWGRQSQRGSSGSVGRQQQSPLGNSSRVIMCTETRVRGCCMTPTVLSFTGLCISTCRLNTAMMFVLIGIGILQPGKTDDPDLILLECSLNLELQGFNNSQLHLQCLRFGYTSELWTRHAYGTLKR